MITSLFPRAPTYNAELKVNEYQGRNDAEAVVNQHGTVNHTKSFWNNIGSGILDAVGAVPGVGNVVNGVRALGNVVTGDFAAGAESALKAMRVGLRADPRAVHVDWDDGLRVRVDGRVFRGGYRVDDGWVMTVVADPWMGVCLQ